MPSAQSNQSPGAGPPRTPGEGRSSGALVQDPFRTAALRRAVLDAWAASPARFREDANAEEALATGGYADRLLVELAANAVDAAAEEGVPGRVRFTLDLHGEIPQLHAANVGARLTAAGVAGLASLRASAKRGQRSTVGHFGVGFTAVLTVTDAPSIISTTGGVRFSEAETRAAVAGLHLPALDAEVIARDGRVPVLRLPWPTEDRPVLPQGFTSQVTLPLRPGLERAVGTLLADVGDELLWALPGLMVVEIDMPGRECRVISRSDLENGLTLVTDGAVAIRYRRSERHGKIPASLLAERPIEERERNQWHLTWILPEPIAQVEERFVLEEANPPGPVFLGAPTPTDEPLSLPARLVGTFPVDDTRRRLAAGPLTEYLLAEAAVEYAELFASMDPAQRFSLVPAAGFPLGPVDASLRQAIIEQLSQASVAVTADGRAVRPDRATVITGISDIAAELIARAVPGLLTPPRSRVQLEAMRVLGVATLPLAEATSALAGIDGPPEFWWDIYDALDDQEAENLADLPVPLAGGGRRIGPAHCLLPGVDAMGDEVLERAAQLAPGLKIVHPKAAHPLLARLGAVPAGATALVSDSALLEVFRQFREQLEGTDPDPVELRQLAALALDLAADSAVPTGALLEDVVLTDEDGEAWPAADLLAPGAPIATVLAIDADLPMVGGEWLRYPQHVLAAVGVRTGLKVVTVHDENADLPDLAQWWFDVVGDGMPPAPFDAIADLDLVDQGKWPQLLQMLAADRRAVGTLTSGPEPSYTRWWIRQFALLAGEPPTHWRLADAAALAGVYDVLPADVDPMLARSIGVLGGAADAVETDPGELVGRWADPLREVPGAAVPGLTALVVTVIERDSRLALPSTVRTLAGTVVDADDALVLDLPWLAQVLDASKVVAGGLDPQRVARLLDLDMASESLSVQIPGAVSEPLTPHQQRAVERAALSIGFTPPVGTLRYDDDLRAEVDGDDRRVRWWPATELSGPAPGSYSDQAFVVDGSPEGIGRAVAFLAGRWVDREKAVSAARGDSLTLTEDGFG